MKTKLLILLLLAVPTIYLSSERYLWDDAVISYRYCQNLLLGKGLVSYDGGPHIEGYSNPSLVFLTAGIAKIIGVSDIPNILRIGLYLNTLALLLCCWLLLKWGRHDLTWWSGLAIILFYPIHIGRQSGLETCLYMMFFTLAVYGFSTKKYRLGILAALMTALSRPEGIGLAAFLVTVYLFSQRAAWKERLKEICMWLVIPFGIFLLWRFYYFGHLISMSAIAKTHMAERHSTDWAGAVYILQAIKAAPILILLLVAPFYRFWKEPIKAKYEISAIGFQVFFIFVVGGDDFFFDFHRFLVPIMPLLFRSTFRSIELLTANYQLRYKYALASCLVVLTALLPVCREFSHDLESIWVHRIYNEIKGATPNNRWQAFLKPEPSLAGYHLSKYLAENIPQAGKNLVLTSVQGGALPLYWQGRFDDAAGLMDYKYASTPRKLHELIFIQNQPDIYADYIWTYYQIEDRIVPAFSALASTKTLEKLGYQPSLIFITVIPPYAKNGKIAEKHLGHVFILYTKDRGLIKAENPSFMTYLAFNDKVIPTPVILIRPPA